MIETTDIKVQYSPLSDTSTFASTIPYFEASDMNVEVVDSNGDTTVLTLNAVSGGFTVVPVNGDTNNGCTITTTEAYGSGYIVTIYRDTPKTQLAEFNRGGDLPPEVLNDALDRGVAISQEITDMIDRTISAPITDPDGLSYTLPTVANRHNKAIGCDADGNITVFDLTDSGTIVGNTNEGINITSNIISVKVDEDSIEFDGSGQVSIKGSGVGTTELEANAVTIAKIQQIATDSVLGRKTAGTGNVEVVPIVGASGILIDSDSLGTSDTAGATQGNIKSYVDSQIMAIPEFSPDTYTGQQSITFPNGLIMKMGTSSSAAEVVTFTTQFPNACINVQATYTGTSVADIGTLAVGNLSAVSFEGFGWSARTWYWVAYGY